MALHYLTVQDILWINLQVTRRTQSFNYARLEEACFYQYGYGQSTSLLQQAGRFLSGFIQKQPFPLGNEATAFVGCMAFLKLNGMKVDLSDDAAKAWLERVGTDSGRAFQALVDVTSEDEEHQGHDLAPDVRSTVSEVLAAYPRTVSLLGSAAKGVSLV